MALPLAAAAAAAVPAARALARPLTPPVPTMAPPHLPEPAAGARPLAGPTPLAATAQQLVEQAIRTAPAGVPHLRSTVRLGFSDSTVVDLRPDDPIARALHTVADALLRRDRG
jgi:hypothetical protein